MREQAEAVQRMQDYILAHYQEAVSYTHLFENCDMVTIQ